MFISLSILQVLYISFEQSLNIQRVFNGLFLIMFSGFIVYGYYSRHRVAILMHRLAYSLLYILIMLIFIALN